MIISNGQIKTISDKNDPLLDPFKCYKMRNNGVYFISNPSVLDKFIDKNGISISDRDRGLLSIKILNKNIKEEESLIIPSVEMSILETQDTKIATVDGIEDLTTNLTSSMYVQVIYEYTTVTSKYYRWSYAINTDPNINDTTKPTVPTITDKESLKHIRATNFRSDWYYTYQSNVLYSRKWDFINDDNSIYNTDSMNDLFVRYDDEVLAEWNILKSYPLRYTFDDNSTYNIIESDSFFTQSDYFFTQSGSFFTQNDGKPDKLYLSDGKPIYTYNEDTNLLVLDGLYNGINTYRNSFYINPSDNLFLYYLPFISVGGFLPNEDPTGTDGIGDPDEDPAGPGDLVVTLGHAIDKKVVSIKTYTPEIPDKKGYMVIHNTYDREFNSLIPSGPNLFPTTTAINFIKDTIEYQKVTMDSRFPTDIRFGSTIYYYSATITPAVTNSGSVTHGFVISTVAPPNRLTIYNNILQVEQNKQWVNMK